MKRRAFLKGTTAVLAVPIVAPLLPKLAVLPEAIHAGTVVKFVTRYSNGCHTTYPMLHIKPEWGDIYHAYPVNTHKL